MSDFEQDLANVVGAFMEINLDCVEKQNQEIEQLQQEKRQLKEIIGEVRQLIKREGCYDEETKIFCDDINYDVLSKLLQILDKVGD